LDNREVRDRATILMTIKTSYPRTALDQSYGVWN